MNRLNVDFAKNILFEDPIESVSLFLDKLSKHSLSYIPWPVYPDKPQVHFSFAYAIDVIFLKFYVREKSIRALVNTINGNVWEDSCVEFFIGFDDLGYYNLEFNCIGTALIGFGKGKSDRELLPEEIIKTIKYQAVINNIHDDIHNVKWELTLAIPASVFMHHQVDFFKTKNCRANFYKCGDNLPHRHFVAWSNITSFEPNFHLPEFFGSLKFK